MARVIDADSDEILHHWQAHEDWVRAIAVSPAGGSLATAGWAGRVKLWDIARSDAEMVGEAR